MAIDGGSVEIRFEGDVAPLRRSVEDAVEQLGSVQKAADQLDDSLSTSALNKFGKKAREEFSDFSNTARSAFGEVVGEAERAVSSINKIGSSIKGLGFGLLTTGATAATGALVSLAKKGIQATDFLETSRVAMAGLTGSIQAGNDAMSLAAKYWQNNPFQRIDVTNATKQLVQFGRTTSQIGSDLDTLGNVSLSTGMNIAELARYYARVSASGRAMTLDLEMMSDRGVPIYRELQKQLKTTTAGVREMASEGKIDFETFRKAMEGAVNAEAMAEYENTLARQMDRFKGSIQILAGDLAGYKIINDQLVISADGLEKTYTKLLNTLSTNLRSTGLREGLEKIGAAIADVMNKIFQFYEQWEEQKDGTMKLVQHSKTLEVVFGALSNVIKFVGENSELLMPILGGVAIALGKLGSNIPIVSNLLNQLGLNKLGGIARGLKQFITLNPILSGTIAILGYGLIRAIKNSEDFRNSMQSIFQSLGKIAQNLAEAFRGIVKVLGDMFTALADSGVVQGILEGVAGAIAWIAEALASIPPEMLATLISFLGGLKLMKANPLYVIAAGIAIVISRIKELGGIGEVLKRIPEQLATIGHNMMTGLANGIQEGARKVFDFMKQLGTSMVQGLRNMLGIHSPSTVMYEVGQNVGLGLANGISDSKNAVEVAMNELAKDIMKISEKVISNKVDFGILDIKQEWQEWKKVSKLFTQGSEQYNQAIEKMEDARKKANLKIIELQKTYNASVDESISRIAGFYDLLDDVNLKAGKNSSQVLKGLDQQVAKLGEWAEAQNMISNLNLDSGLVKELQSMGVESTSELSAIANMTADELATLNEMWLKKQKIANEAGIKQMEGFKNETIDQINDLKNGIDGATVDVDDVGGRLVSRFSEGVYGAIPTLENAFGRLGDYIAKARADLAKSAGGAGSDTEGLGVPDTGMGEEAVAQTLKEELSDGLNKMKDMLPNVLMGLIGSFAAVKLGPKIIKALGGKLFGGIKGGFLGNIFSSKLGEAAKEMSKTAEPVKKIAESANVISEGVGSTNKSFSKADSLMGSIQKGAQTVMWIAGAIAAVAGALWITYNALKDIDFGKLTLQLIAMGLAVVEFGALAKAASMLKIGAKEILVIAGIAADIGIAALACRVAYELMKGIDFLRFQLVLLEMAEALVVMGALATAAGVVMEATVGAMALGMLAVIGLAGDIALSAVAIKSAYDMLVPIDFGKFQLVILEMIEALGVMGGFSTLFGILSPLVGLGWLSIIAICDELVKTSEALYKVYTRVPDDFDGVTKKIDLIKKVLNKIIDTDLGSLIGSIVASWEVGPLTRTMDMYMRVAEQLGRLSEININEQKVTQNLNYVQSALEKVKSKTDAISGWLQAWADDANANSVESAGRIIITYGEVVDALNKLENLKVSNEVYNGINAVATVVKYVRDTSSNMFGWFSNIGGFASDVEHIKNIISTFVDMIPTVKEIADGKNDIRGIKDKALRNIEAVEEIVRQAGECGTGGWISNKESDLGLIQSILNKFTELIPVAWQIANSGTTRWKGDALKQIEAVEAIVLKIGSVDTGGWIEQKENDLRLIQSIVNKFTEILPVANQIASMGIDENAGKAIDKVKEIINKIGSINTGWANTASTKEWIVGMASSIAWKMTEFAEATRNIGGVNSEAVSNTVTAMNDMFTTVSNDLSQKVVVFENVGVRMAQSLANGIRREKLNMQLAGIELQSSLWSALESKMGDEYQQGVWMATQFGNGLKSVNFSNVGQAMQSSLWWSIQNRMQDEYYQGQAMGYRFRQGLYDVDYANSGWWAAQGFINGVHNRAYSGSAIWWEGYNLASEFLRGLKKRSGEGSPWKTTMESGAWAVEGLINGMKESESALVGEANSLADQVADALTMDDLSMSPELNVSGRANLAPSMATGEYAIIGGSGGGVTVQQTNNNYTQYDVEQVQRDLAWELSKV